MEKDIIQAVTVYWPKIFSIMLFQHDIISLSNLKIIGLLSQDLPPKKLSLILVEILANNVKITTRFKDFINFLGKISSLNYLSKTMNMLLG